MKLALKIGNKEKSGIFNERESANGLSEREGTISVGESSVRVLRVKWRFTERCLVVGDGYLF